MGYLLLIRCLQLKIYNADMLGMKVDEGNITMKDTKENGQNRDNGQNAGEEQRPSFFEKLLIGSDRDQVDEDAEEAYQGF